jgi:epoxyqueuosine reductase QueG
MEQDKELTNKVIEYSGKKGVDIIGFADPKLFDRFPKENQPSVYLKETKTVIIIGIHLYDIMLDIWSKNEETGKDVQFADSLLINYCNSIRNFLTKRGYESKIIPYGPGLYLKDSAALAGMGSIGKNNLLVTEKYGSQVRLRAIATTAPLIIGESILESNFCKDCSICIDACPANAFPNGKYNKEICFNYLYSEWRILSKYSRLFCNECIESCPIGKPKS